MVQLVFHFPHILWTGSDQEDIATVYVNVREMNGTDISLSKRGPCLKKKNWNWCFGFCEYFWWNMQYGSKSVLVWVWFWILNIPTEVYAMMLNDWNYTVFKQYKCNGAMCI